MSGFWRTWMTAWCWAVALFGVVLMGGAFEATSGPTRALFAILKSGEPFTPDALTRFCLALMGAVTFGWSLTLMTAIQAAHQLGAAGRATWVGMIVSVLAWYVTDSSLSVATGFGLNAVSNTILVAGFLLPVVRSGVLKT